jgi:hypothetical protein
MTVEASTWLVVSRHLSGMHGDYGLYISEPTPAMQKPTIMRSGSMVSLNTTQRVAHQTKEMVLSSNQRLRITLTVFATFLEPVRLMQLTGSKSRY